MSYILDALKKSEAERRATAVAGGVGGAVYIVDAAGPAAWWRPVGLTLLAVAVVAVAALWLPRDSSREDLGAAPAVGPVVAPSTIPEPPVVIAPESSPVTVAARPAESIPVRNETVVAALPEKPARAASRAAVTTRQPGAAAVPRAVTVAGPVSFPAPAPRAPEAVASGRPTTAIPTAAPREAAPASADVRLSTVAQSAPTPAAVASPASAEAPAANVAGPVASADLPAALRSELPRLTVSGFAGGEDRDARFAVINDRIVREGEEFAPGLRLAQVGQDGVIVEYRGTRFRP